MISGMQILLAPLLYAMWSSMFPVGKWLLEFSSPIFLTGTRMTFAGLILFAYLLLRKRGDIRALGRREWLSLAVLGFFSVYASCVLEFKGLKHLTAAKTCFIYSLSPFFTIFFSYLHFGEKMTRMKWIGMLIGFLGIFPVLMVQTGSEELLNAFSFLSWPEIYVMGAALFASYGWTLLRLMVKEVSPAVANAISMLFGGAMALIHSYFLEGFLPISSGALAPLAYGTLIMTLISNIICYNLYGYLLQRYTATLLSFIGLLSPIFASLNAWLILREPPSPLIFISTGIISIGLWIVYRVELRQGYLLKSPQSAK